MQHCCHIRFRRKTLCTSFFIKISSLITRCYNFYIYIIKKIEQAFDFFFFLYSCIRKLFVCNWIKCTCFFWWVQRENLKTKKTKQNYKPLENKVSIKSALIERDAKSEIQLKTLLQKDKFNPYLAKASAAWFPSLKVSPTEFAAHVDSLDSLPAHVAHLICCPCMPWCHASKSRPSIMHQVFRPFKSPHTSWPKKNSLHTYQALASSWAYLRPFMTTFCSNFSV